MRYCRVFLEDETAAFYEKAADNLNITREELMSKLLFAVAGELSLAAMK